jgi:hypothetical protein
MTSYYEPSPLTFPDSIRLVELHAGVPSANVTCTVIQTRLGDAPPYEAISYTWGATDDQLPLACGPAGAQIIIMVTRNCESMLRRLRSSDATRLVWVDAICIDQGNIDERNAQVAMMGQIFQSARRVVIDIGETSDSSDEALHAIMHCSEQTLYAMDLGLRIKDAVSKLYERAWFGRVWVLQEAFRSKEAVVLCGTGLVPWSIFRPFRIWVDSRPAWETEHWHVALPSIVPPALTVGNHHSRTYTAREDLLSLLVKGSTCDATDPRDKVFAMLPILADAPAEKLHADYAKGTAQVFIETATWLLSAVGLSFLPCAGAGPRIDELPSWVPDWSARFREPWMIGLGGVYYPLSAGGHTAAVALALFPGPLLKARGIAVDTIRTTSASLKVNIRSDSAELTKFVADCRSYRTTDPRGPARLPAARAWEPRTNETRLHPPNWAAWKYGLPFETPLDISDNELANLVTYFCASRQLVLTERGYFGVAPSDAVPGDTVVCLLGAGVPYILRQVAQDGPTSTTLRYKLVGESYLYGLMAGEALEGVDLSGVKQQDAPAPFEDFFVE